MIPGAFARCGQDWPRYSHPALRRNTDPVLDPSCSGQHEETEMWTSWNSAWTSPPVNVAEAA